MTAEIMIGATLREAEPGRNAITNDELDTLTQNLNLHGNQYNTTISILFCGYLIGQLPSNMVLTRVKPSLYMTGFTVTWSRRLYSASHLYDSNIDAS
ncbi:hypothetical protein V1506DRAFT_510279 [Lipomyces tetrasporus]